MLRTMLGRHRTSTLLLTGAVTTVAVLGMSTTAHADPLGWTFTAPPPTADRLSLNGIATLSDTSVWTVGRDSAGALASHWDGQAWTSTPVPGMNWLNDASFDSESDGWAIGGGTDTTKNATHWNGTDWTPVATPMPDAGDDQPWLTAVDGGGTDVWAAGNTGTVGGGPDGVAFFEHWDGSQWTLIEPKLPQEFTAYSISDINVAGADDAWAVGSAYQGQVSVPLIMHWDGSDWSMQKTPNQPTGTMTTTTIVDGEVWAGGFGSVDNSPIAAVPLLMHLVDGEWTTVKTPQETSWWYNMVPDGNGGLIMGGYTQGADAILRWDGTTASIEPGPIGGKYATVRAMDTAEDGSGDVWTVGDAGTDDVSWWVAHTS
jgi:hypothetical protein